jgi:lipoate-protein ligase A
MDVAVSHSVLSAVSEGGMGPVLRLYVPGRVVAFGLADRVANGYRFAVRAAKAHGYSAVERLAGGRAAVFHEGTLAFSWATPDPDPKTRIEERFKTISGIMADAFDTLGIDARVGQLPGEYCPGDWSVNVGGRVKVMGVGQRIVRGAAHVGGVVVVDHGHRIRDVLIPIYRALHLDWDPRTAGSLADRSPGLNTDHVTRAIIDSFSERFTLQRGELPAHLVDRARNLIPGHLPEVA